MSGGFSSVAEHWFQVKCLGLIPNDYDLASCKHNTTCHVKPCNVPWLQGKDHYNHTKSSTVWRCLFTTENLEESSDSKRDQSRFGFLYSALG